MHPIARRQPQPFVALAPRRTAPRAATSFSALTLALGLMMPGVARADSVDLSSLGAGTFAAPGGTQPAITLDVPGELWKRRQAATPAALGKTDAAGATDDQGPPVDFEADQVEYDNDADIVTATGNVFMRRQQQSVRADKVTWNRKTGQIVATGNIRAINRDGDELLTDRMDLTDQFDVGETQNMLLLLREGGRLAAAHGKRLANGEIILNNAAYTGCDVINTKGCPTTPSWRITAHVVTYNADQKLITFKGARLALFGIPLIPLPGLKQASDGRALSGFLIPNARLSNSNGLEYDQTYYMRLAENKDLAVTGYVFSKIDPMVSAHYRQLTDTGAFQFTGYVTSSDVIPQATPDAAGKQQMRGYIDTNGHFQLSPEWSISFSGRLVSDRTFLNRYYINGDDTLRSNITAERIDHNSYLSISGWSFETLRLGESQGQQPIALPEIDYRRRLDDLVLGGQVQFEANSLAISRSAGQDTQRAFASVQWDRHLLTDWGQQITFTGLARGDVYHSSGNWLTTPDTYQGAPGWQSRGMVLGAVDVQWPLVGEAFGGTQVLTPHVQIVASPHVPNANIPNEDSRAVELEDDNLFALSRIPGYDRVEDGTRVTYGLTWQLTRPSWRIITNVGQSYRLVGSGDEVPDGTGFYDRLSDIVGRTDIKFRDFLTITHRYRLDKDSLAFRRNEIDATIGSDRSYIEVGYARLNRDIAEEYTDLANSNEARAATRLAFARYWSLFASGVFDLSGDSTTATAVATSTSIKSFQPLRTRVGFGYSSNCFELDVTWRRDYITIGDASKGSSFELRFSLKNIGFR